jgi:hypothetical protein
VVDGLSVCVRTRVEHANDGAGRSRRPQLHLERDHGMYSARWACPTPCTRVFVEICYGFWKMICLTLFANASFAILCGVVGGDWGLLFGSSTLRGRRLWRLHSPFGSRELVICSLTGR